MSAEAGHLIIVSGDHLTAAVCRRGHVQASGLAAYPASQKMGHCPDCGARVLVTCSSCQSRIRGASRSVVTRPGTAVAQGYAPPNCCDHCGRPHPWAPREALVYELENILDEEDIDEADRLVVADHLRRLRELDLQDDDAPAAERTLWTAVKRRAPQLFAGPGKMILERLVDHATKKALGIEQ